MSIPQRGSKANAFAFTLIELLIVIAIISILAMIAIPNFLEAQTRSKVVRVKADMRTIKTALETYAVDWNSYPPDNGGQEADYYNTWRRLTTPVAYITSIPESPFNEKETPRAHNNFEYWRGAPPDYDPGTFATGIWYRFTSVGPDQKNDGAPNPVDIAAKTPEFVNKLYDPTNGTISSGDILATSQKIY